MDDTRLTLEEIGELTAKWADTLGLSHWQIDLRVRDLDSEHSMMEVIRSPDYDRAHISVAPFLVKDGPDPRDFVDAIDAKFTERCLVHELMHCHIRSLKRVALDFTEPQLHRDVFSLLEEAWKHAEEATVDRIAVALADSVSKLP